MTFINDFVSQWFPMIEKPIYINGKQGFLLSNGFRIFFNEYNLSNLNKGILKRHYTETLNAKETVTKRMVDKKLNQRRYKREDE